MDKEKLKEFKKQQPYKSSVVANPWDRAVIDAEEVHARQFEEVMEAVDNVKATKASLIFVLQGEPGSGKSHLLWRIAKSAEEKQFLFVSITPYITVNGVSYETMLESTMGSLQKIHPALKSKPIDHILGWTVKEGLKDYRARGETNKFSLTLETISSDKKLPYVAKSIFETIPEKERKKIEKSMKETLIRNHPKMPRYFVNLLIKMLEPKTYSLTIDFLSGEKLSAEELKKLNLSGNFSLNENVAFKILYSLFNFSPFPFIISIDQIETLDYHLNKNKIREFFEKLIMLFTNSGNVMFLLSVQTQTFKKWESFLPTHIADRLSMRTTIYPITLEDAKAIVRKRNAFYWKKIGVADGDTLYPFDEESVKNIYSAGNRNPRRLIKALDYLLERGIVKASEKPNLKETFKKYVEGATAEKLRYEISDLFIKALGGKVIKKTTTYFIVDINGTAFALNNSKHSYWSCVKYLSKSLEKGKIARAILIRTETMRIKSSAVKTQLLIKEHGIAVRYYNKDEAKNLSAVAKMLRDTESGDTELGIKAVKKFAEEKLKEFLPSVFENRSSKKEPHTSKAEENLKKLENFLSKITVTTMTKIVKNTGLSSKEAYTSLKTLEKKGKVRLLKRSGEVWIFRDNGI